MLEKRFWPNIIYVLLLFLICMTIWQVAVGPGQIPNLAMFTLYPSNASSYTYPISALSSSDYEQLIDLKDFSFKILNIRCNDTPPLLLILIHSHPSHIKARQTIRDTWGRNTHQVKVLFSIGLARSEEERRLLKKENEEYSDLIQGSFLDSYRNMTYKHVMVFKYAIYHCPHAKYILKTDDDVFVNMPLMLNFLTSELSPYGGAGMLFCPLRKNARVIRSWRSKWRVSFKEYPAKTYPPYCPGWALLYSPDVIFNLYKEAQRNRYFWIDDVHITGTLAEKVHISHADIESLVLKENVGSIVNYSKNFSRSFLYGYPNMKEREIRALWGYIIKNREVTPTSIIKDISLEKRSSTTFK